MHDMSFLISLLITCEGLLRSVDEIFWADRIKSVIQKNNGSLDIYTLEEIISWYGGMGSFRDLLISEHNSHFLGGRDEEKLNCELDELRSNIYRKAKGYMYLKKFR